MSTGFGCNLGWLIRVLAWIEGSEKNREGDATVIVVIAC